MSDVSQGGGVSTPSGSASQPSGAQQPQSASHPNRGAPASNQAPERAGQHASPSNEQSQSIDGKSATGSPDKADKAAEAVQPGRELTAKELAMPVTRVVNGQKVTRPISEWIGASQLEQASHQRFQQAQAMMKQAEQIVSSFKQNPRAFLAQNGIDPVEFSKATLSEQLEMMGMTPEQRELMALRQEKKQREDYEKQQEEQKKIQSQQELDSKEYNQMVQDSLSAWKESGLPEDPYFGQRMAAEIARHQAQGIPLTWKEAASIVKQDWMNSTNKVLASFPEVEALANFLGEPVLKKLREYEIARVTSKEAAKAQKRPGSQPASRKPRQPQFVNEHEYQDWWAKKHAEYGGNS